MNCCFALLCFGKENHFLVVYIEMEGFSHYKIQAFVQQSSAYVPLASRWHIEGST